MEKVLTVIAIALLAAVLIFIAPAIVAWSLGALFGLAFWPCWWLGLGLGLLTGGISAKVNT